MPMKTSLDGARKRLKAIREKNQRRSREVLQLWDVVKPNINTFGNESFVIMEQVTLAALDCHDLEQAKFCFERLHNKYQNSVRCLHLRGLIFEAEGNLKEAGHLYQNLLEKNEGDLFSRKRQIAICKAEGKISDTVEALVKYLNTFPADYEAWIELCAIYTSKLDFYSAIRCAEELIMAQPHNYLYHQRLGELYYSCGDFSKSRVYYLHALKLKPDDLRSLFGLYATLLQFSQSTGSNVVHRSGRSGKSDGSDKDSLPNVIMCRIKELHSRVPTNDIRLSVLKELPSVLLQSANLGSNTTPTASPQSLTQ